MAKDLTDCARNLRTWRWVRGALLAGLVLCIGWTVLGATAVDDAAVTEEDKSVLIDVLANDVGASSVSSVTDPDHGTAVIEANQLRYTPDPDFCGTDSFTYTASNGGDDTAWVTVEVLCVNDGPVAVDEFLATRKNAPLTFALRASDPDIDPGQPEVSPLVFVTIAGPSHGLISGDLSAVAYEAPSTALVTVKYTPAMHFVGTDSLTFAVTDPYGAVSTAVIQIDVGPPPEIGHLSGKWSTTIVYQWPQTPSVKSVTTALATLYRVGSVNVRANATWSDADWSALSFSADFPLADNATVQSSLAFDPAGAAFRHWQTVTRFALFGLNLNHTVHVPQSPSALYQSLVVRGRLEDLSFTSMTKLTGRCLCFDEEVLTTQWVWPGCDLRVDTRLRIDQDGFDHFSVKIDDFPLLDLEEVGFGIYVDLETKFSVESKVLTPTFACRAGAIGCLRMFCEVTTDGGFVHGISVYGIGLQTSFPAGIEVSMATSLVEARNAAVTGYFDYFEVYRLSGRTAPCCGAPGLWQIATYFQHDSSELFDWGMTTLRLETALTEQVRLASKLAIRAAAPKLEWSLSWTARW